MADRKNDTEEFLTIQEISDLLRIRVSAARARLARNDVSLPPSVRVGGRRLFPRSLYVKWLEAILVADLTEPTTDTGEGVPFVAQARHGLPKSLSNSGAQNLATNPPKSLPRSLKTPRTRK